MNREAFRAGFIAGLADLGYTPTEFEERLEKTAVVGWVLPAAVGAGALALSGLKTLGRGAGQAAQVVTEPSERDLDIAKKEEELETYKVLIREAKRRAAEQARTQIPSAM